jgi:hypothetical protein
VELPAELVALAGELTPQQLTPEQVAGLAGSLGLTELLTEQSATARGTARGMAAVNTLLAAASPALRENLLIEFVGLLLRPRF